jgi:DNA invertase Pin-like site-specific DNA recombinase
LCRVHAAKNGLDVVGTYDDRASSGASIFGRDGLIRLMDAARDGAFDVILVEALDRLSCDQDV